MVCGEAASTRREAPMEKSNLWSQELRVSVPYNFRIIHLIKPVWSWCACFFFFIDTDSWDLIVRDSAYVMPHEERIARKESAIKSSFSKKCRSQLRSTHYICFRSQQDKKNFWTATLVLLYQVKLNIARQNGQGKQKNHSAAFFNKQTVLRTIGK